MAIITIGPPLAGIRGTVGGITFSANKSGTYAKIWTTTTNPRTPAQSRQRGLLARMSALWNALTSTQKLAWDTFAALSAQDLINSLGETFSASGFNWFSKCNVRLLRVGLSPLTAVPTQARPSAPTITDFVVTVAGTESDLTVGGTPSASTFEFGFFPANAFDDNIFTDWKTLTPGNPTGWIRYDLPTSQNIKHYSVRSSSTAAAALRPTAWQFQVFTGGFWTTLQTITGISFFGAEKKDFFTANPFTETDYRLNITANQGDPNQVTIAEFELFAGDEGSSVITYPQDEFDATPDYDLILHISLGRSTGQQVQFPGFAEVLAIADPGRDHETIQDQLTAVFGTILLNRSWFAELYRQTTQGLRSAAATARTITVGP